MVYVKSRQGQACIDRGWTSCVADVANMFDIDLFVDPN